MLRGSRSPGYGKSVHSDYLRSLCGNSLQNRGADERTRTADLLITSDHSGVAGGCGGCESRISRRFPLLRVAECCTVLRSRWYQSGVNIVLSAAARVSSRSPWVLDPSCHLDRPRARG